MSKFAKDVSTIKAFVFDVDGVLSSSTQQIDADGMLIRTGNIKDGLALRKALKAGYKIAIITGGNTRAVELRYQYLGVTDIFSGISKKLPKLEEWMQKEGLKPEEIAYMGDDLPDLPCLRIVGLSACPYDAVAEVIQTADYVSKFTGGYGCVRDFIESLMLSQTGQF